MVAKLKWQSKLLDNKASWQNLHPYHTHLQLHQMCDNDQPARVPAIQQFSDDAHPHIVDSDLHAMGM